MPGMVGSGAEGTTSPVLIPVTLAEKETSFPCLKYPHLRILTCEMQKARWCLSPDDCEETQRS